MTRFLLTFSALAILGCAEDRATQPPASGSAALLVQATWSRDAGPTDSLAAQGDSILVWRAIPQDSCCLAHLVPTVLLKDSTLHLTLQSPSSPATSYTYSLRLQTVIRLAGARPTRLIQEVRYPGRLVRADTVAMPSIRAANTLPPLQIGGAFTQGTSGAEPESLTAVTVANGVAYLQGSVNAGGFDPYLQVRLVPTLTDTLVTLDICCGGGPFPTITPIHFTAAVGGLAPGRRRLRIAFQGRVLDTAVTIP
jgi:hypothetical protein